MIARTSACKKTHRQLRVREQLSGALVGETSLVCKDCAKHKPTALPLKSTKAPIFSLEDWGGRWDLNPRHSEPQSDALPAELLPPYSGTAYYRTASRREGSNTWNA